MAHANSEARILEALYGQFRGRLGIQKCDAKCAKSKSKHFRNADVE